MGPGPGRGAWERVSPRGGCRAWGRYRQGLPVSPWKSAGLPGARRLENVFFFFLKKKQKTKSTPPGPGRGAWERVRPRGGCRAWGRHRQGLPVSPWKSAGLPGARNFETVYQGHELARAAVIWGAACRGVVVLKSGSPGPGGGQGGGGGGGGGECPCEWRGKYSPQAG